MLLFQEQIQRKVAVRYAIIKERRRQLKHIRSHLWDIYFITVNNLMFRSKKFRRNIFRFTIWNPYFILYHILICCGRFDNLFFYCNHCNCGTSRGLLLGYLFLIMGRKNYTLSIIYFFSWWSNTNRFLAPKNWLQLI